MEFGPFLLSKQVMVTVNFLRSPALVPRPQILMGRIFYVHVVQGFGIFLSIFPLTRAYFDSLTLREIHMPSCSFLGEGRASPCDFPFAGGRISWWAADCPHIPYGLNNQGGEPRTRTFIYAPQFLRGHCSPED